MNDGARRLMIRAFLLAAGNGRTMESTKLSQEVRAMNEGRDENLIAQISIQQSPSLE